jgi:hypothetical protein
MGNKLKFGIGFLVFAATIVACDKFEFRGFVSSYESANERFEESRLANDSLGFQNITVSSDSYEIYVMGDSHLGETDNFDAFVSTAISNNASGAILVGDITSGNEKDYKLLKQHLPLANALNIFPIAGNHDLYFDGWQHFKELFGSTSYYFTVQTPVASDLFICLDSGSGTLGSKQLAWLEATLKNERPKYRYCSVYTHNNLFRIRHTTSTNPNMEEIQAIIELTLEHNVDMVVTAHDHFKNERQLGNTRHITMDALLDGFSDAGYSIVSVDTGKLKHKFINL